MKTCLSAFLFFSVSVFAHPTCIRFEGCLDGGDFIQVENGYLKIIHHSDDVIGRNESCKAITTANGQLSLYGEKLGAFVVDGRRIDDAASEVAVRVRLDNLESFHMISGRGTIVLDPYRGHQIYLADISPDGLSFFTGAERYVVDLCE